MRPTLESIGTISQEPASKRPALESIVAPSYDYGILERDERIQQFMADTPDIDSNTKAQLINSLYIADTYKVPFEQAFQHHDGIVKDLFGAGTTAEAALSRIQSVTKSNLEKFNEYDEGYYNKARAAGASRPKSAFFSFWKKATDRYNRTGINLVNEVIGLIEATGDVTFSETLQDWSSTMRLGVEQYIKENPEEFLNPGGKGFFDTTWAYVSNPEYILLGALEQTPNIALSYIGGVAGKAIAGAAGGGAAAIKTGRWIGGVQGFAVPSFGRRYSDLRGDGISPIGAFPEAFLGSQAEGLLEEWTLGKKIKIFQNAGKAVERSMGTIVSRTLLGGGKVYARGAFEEGTQQISDNFLAILFRDVDIGLLNDVGNQAAAGGILEVAMAGGFHTAGSFSRQVNKVEKLQRLETLREKINEMPLNVTHKAEINTEIDALVERVESEKVLFTAPAVEDVQIIETPATDIVAEIQRTPRFGMAQSASGTWRVIDYETQKEVGTAGGARHATNQMNQFNSGKLTIEVERKPPLLPSEKVTLTARSMLNAVMKGVSKAAQTAYIQGAKDAIKGTTNLGKFANELLGKLDITAGQRKTLINAVTKPRTATQQITAMATIQRLADIAQHKKSVNDLKKTITYINRRSGKSRQEGGIDPDYLEKMKAVTDTFLLKKISPKQRKKAVSLAAYLEGIKNNEAVVYSDAYAELRIPKELLAKVGQLELKTVDDMTVKELEDINQLLQHLIHLNKTKNAIINRRTGARVAEALNAAVEEANNLKDKSSLIDNETINLTDRPVPT